MVPKDVHINVGLGDQLAAMLEAMQAQQEHTKVVNGEAVEVVDIMSTGDAVVTSND